MTNADNNWIRLGKAARDLVAKLKVTGGEIQGAIDRSPTEEIDRADVDAARCSAGGVAEGNGGPTRETPARAAKAVGTASWGKRSTLEFEIVPRFGCPRPGREGERCGGPVAPSPSSFA